MVFDEVDRLYLVRDRFRREWAYPGGFVDRGESPRQACVREIREEIGLALASERFRLLGAEINQQPWRELEFTTFSTTITPAEAHNIVLQALELTDGRWVTRQEALELIAPRLRERLTELLVAHDLAA